MATDPFSDIGFNTEIGQPTFTELIIAKQETGTAIRTICYDGSNGEEVCDEGPSPSLRLRELAFGKKRQTPSVAASTVVAAKQTLAVQKLALNASAVSNSRILKAQQEFFGLLTPQVGPSINGSVCSSNYLINGKFVSDLSGWDTVEDVFWTSLISSAALRRNFGDPVPELSQLAIVETDKFLRLNFDLILLTEYTSWELTIEVKDSNTTIYSSTVNQDDGFGTFSIGEIPPCTTGICTVSFSNTTEILEDGFQTILNIDNVKLCNDSIATTLSCSSGFNVIEKTELQNGRNNWLSDGTIISDRAELVAIPKPITLTPGELGLYNGNSDGVTLLRQLSDKILASTKTNFNIASGDIADIESDDSKGYVFAVINTPGEYIIRRFNADGSNPTDIHTENTNPIDALALETVNEYVYFSTGQLLRRVNFQGGSATTLYTVPSGNILRIAVDQTNNKLYLVQNNEPTSSSIIRVSANGNNPEVLNTSIDDPRCIELDIQNNIAFIGTGEVSSKVYLFELKVNGVDAGQVTELMSSDLDPVSSGNTSFRSISDIEIGFDGLLYLMAGYSIWTAQPNGDGFTNVFNPNQYVDLEDPRNPIHITYGKRTIMRKFFRNLEPDSPVRFSALFDGTLSDTESRQVYIELARPEGGNVRSSVINDNTGVVTYSAGQSGILSANIILDTSDENVDVGLFECLICGGLADTRPQCTPSAPNEIDFQDFNVNDGGWIYGINPTWQGDGGYHEITGEGGEYNFVTKAFTGLAPNSILEFHFDLLKVTGGSARVLITEAVGTENIIAEETFETSGVDNIITAITTVDTVVIQIQIQPDETFGTPLIRFDNALLCAGTVGDCRITNTSIELEWSGAPIRPVNMFEVFARYKIRDRIDPTKTAFVNQPALGADHIISTTDCDFWKQQGNGGVATSNPISPTVNIGNVEVGDEVEPNTNNWLWSVPLEGALSTNDILVINVDDPQKAAPGRIATGDLDCGADIDASNYDPNCVVESFNIVFQANRILTVTEKENICDQGTLTARIKFKDGSGLNRAFEQEVDLAALYSTTDDPAAENWDIPDVLGNGIPGDTARWESIVFPLDTLSGNGLNQCTVVETPTFTGSGTLNFGSFTLNGSGAIAEPCDPEVIITTEGEGSKTNEIQSIVLPGPKSGTYEITFSNRGVTDSVEIPWNAEAAQLRVRLGSLSTIGGTQNVNVVGTGNEDNPFLVTFTGDLGGQDVNILHADGSDLNGSGEAFVRTIRNGTLNEQQTIYNDSNSVQNFTITFNGETTEPITYNAPLADVENILEGLSSIGTGNVIVTGNNDDRESEYSGPWVVQFQGDLAEQNLPEMIPNSIDDGYLVITDWNGGGGINEIQELSINADGGTYTLEFTNPYNSEDVQTTGDLAYNASKSDILATVIGSIGWLDSTNFGVRFKEEGVFELIFKDELWGLNIPQTKADSDLLVGGDIEVTEVVKGGGDREKQRIRMRNVTGGTWKLTLDVPDVGNLTTGSLDWDAEAVEIEEALTNLPGVSIGDVSVGGEFPVYLVVFRQSLGNIDLMEATIDNLQCTGFVVVPVGPPPYDYDLNQEPDTTPPPSPPPKLPLDDDINVYTKTNYQRYLFDPNFKPELTLREMALSKGVDLFDYTPYLRSCDNSLLRPVEYDREVTTKESYVLVENAIDSVLERQRILTHLATHREILPMRFTWNCLET